MAKGKGSGRGRAPTHGQPYKGIQEQKSGSTWTARVDNQNVGSFDDAKSAAHGFDRALCVLKGPGQKYNLPQYMPPELEAELAKGFEQGEAGLKLYSKAHKLWRAHERNLVYCSGSSSSRGVAWDAHGCVYFVQVTNGPVLYWGPDEEAAAHVYDKDAIRRLGRLAATNFPLETYFSKAELDAIDKQLDTTLSPAMKGKAGMLENATPEQRAAVKAYLAADSVDPFLASKAAAADSAAGAPQQQQQQQQVQQVQQQVQQKPPAAGREPAREAAPEPVLEPILQPKARPWPSEALAVTHAAVTGCTVGLEEALRMLSVRDPSLQGSILQTALAQSTACGHTACIKALLDAGADVNVASDGSGLTALHVAAASRSVRVDVVELLLDRDANVLAEDNHGVTPLQLADVGGGADLQLLLRADHVRKGGSVLAPTGAAGLGRQQAPEQLHDLVRSAIQSGHPAQLARLLVQHGACAARPPEGDVLGLAAALERPACLQLLLAFGVDHRVPDQDGDTALHDAISLGSECAVKVLLDWGADPHAKNRHGTSPLQQAEAYAPAFLDLLVAAKQTSTAAFPPPSSSARSEPIAGSDSAAVVSEEPSERKDLQSIDFTTVPRPQLVQLLTRPGADPDGRGVDGNTYLHLAAGSDAITAMEVLLAAGASIDARNDRGETPLHCAADRGHVRSAKLLLEMGADARVESELGARPAQTAAIGGYNLLRATLLAAARTQAQGKPLAKLRKQPDTPGAPSPRPVKSRRDSVVPESGSGAAVLPLELSVEHATTDMASGDQVEGPPGTTIEEDEEGDYGVDSESARRVSCPFKEADATWEDTCYVLNDFQDAGWLEGPLHADDPGQRLTADAQNLPFVTGRYALCGFSVLVAATIKVVEEATGETFVALDTRLFSNGAQAPGAPAGTKMYQRAHTDAAARIPGMYRLIAWQVPPGYEGEHGVLAPCNGRAPKLYGGEGGTAAWLFRKEFLATTVHKNHTTHGYQTCTLVVDMVPKSKWQLAQRAGYQRPPVLDAELSALLSMLHELPRAELPADFSLAASRGRERWRRQRARLEPVLPPPVACRVFHADDREGAAAAIRGMPCHELIACATQIYGFEVSHGGLQLRLLLTRSIGYDARMAYDLAAELTPTAAEAQANRRLQAALSTEGLLRRLHARTPEEGLLALTGLFSDQLYELFKEVFPASKPTVFQAQAAKWFTRFKLAMALGVREQAALTAANNKGDVVFEKVYFRRASIFPAAVKRLLKVATAGEAVAVVCNMGRPELTTVYTQVYKDHPMRGQLPWARKELVQAAGMKREDARRAVEQYELSQGRPEKVPRGHGGAGRRFLPGTNSRPPAQ